MASSVDSHSHDTFDSDEMDLQHPHSDSNNDSDASMTETDTLDHDPATALQSMQAIHPRHSLEQQKQQRSISYRHSLNHHFNHHFPLLNHPQASAPSPSPSASTAANTAAVAATAAAVAAAVASAAVASSVGDAESPLERKSHLRRKCDRLQVKNAALKATVIQVKSDLALERQKRSTVDQIYLNIRKDLNQRLESEEDKVLGLKADLEQMAAEMKELKDQLASAKSRYSPFSTSAHMSSLNSRSNNGYRIGYDSSAFSLTRGISALGGVHMPHSSSLIDGHDDSEEFLFSHSYSSSARHPSVSQPINKDSTLMSCSDDDNEDDDEEMEEEDESDDESGAAKGAFLFKQPPVSRRGSVASSITLRSLAEETIEEEEEEEDDDEELDEEDEVDSDREGRSENRDDADDSDAPRTMMEIILQRQQSRSPEDDMEDPPADANETFESMAQKVLVQAIHSRFTVAQAQLQIEELIVKYEAPFDKAVEALTQGILRWWETERMATGGSVSGGWGVDPVVINKESGEQASPKVAVEKRIESFFGPLLLQFVASIAEQKMLLEKLGEQAQAESEGRWLRNHNAILVALYKYDVLDGEAVLEWWRTLEEPQGVFGHGGNNLRSLNSRFVAWLEDEDDESDSESEDEEEDSDSDSSCSEFESSDSEDDDNDDDDDEEDEEETKRGDDSTETKEAMEQDAVVEAILDMAFPTTASTTTNTTTKSTNRRGSENSITSSTSRTTGNVKRRISFCTNNNLYYSQDGKVQTAPRKAKGGNNNDTDGGGEERVDGEDEEVDEDEEDSSVVKKKYDQCPPFKGIMDRDIEIGTMA
ncbi:hypothetical protein BGX29_006367 [Mortierella sp. GBA35]|nr:hypothetical protein BGX29_006367 [Mortierella sp. GBA35]